MRKHAMRAILVLSAVAMLFGCGAQNAPNKSSIVTGASSVSSSSVSLAKAFLIPSSVCQGSSDTATVAAGLYHTVGLKKDGTVLAIGNNGNGQLNVSSWTGIKSVAAGYYHTVGLNEDGTVLAVGNNGIGQLDVTSWTGIKAIAAGAYHTVGLKDDGTVVAVGHDVYNQLDVASWTGIKAIAAGAYHTVGLKDGGTVVAVGMSNFDQLSVSSWTNIKAIAAGGYHTIGLKDDGTVVTAGLNGNGQLDVSTWTGINTIAGGGYHTVGITDDGTALAVGYDAYKQLDVSAWANMKTASSVDVSAPVTNATLIGTRGNNGWYVSDVQVTLAASDDCGSGVKEIHYIIDGTETVAQASSASQTITTDGTHVVTFYAVDKAGNMELLPQKVSIKIDKTPPSIPFLTANPLTSWPLNHKMIKVLIGGRAADSGSGIASTTITVTDECGICNLTASHFNSVVTLSSGRAGTDKDSKLYTIKAVVMDKAGNQSTKTSTIRFPHDIGHHHTFGWNNIQDWRPDHVEARFR